MGRNANDRLQEEVLDVTVGTADDRNTVYTYDGTTQTGKTVRTGTTVGSGTEQEDHTLLYDVQGRLESITVDKTGSGGSSTTTTYQYNDSGLRVSQTESGVTTLYHFDPNNPTGFAQVLEEKRDLNGSGLDVTDPGDINKAFTLGHDVILQTAPADPSVTLPSGIAAHDPLYLLYDGHGSTRALLDDAAAIVEKYAYDAYSNLLLPSADSPRQSPPGGVKSFGNARGNAPLPSSRNA